MAFKKFFYGNGKANKMLLCLLYVLSFAGLSLFNLYNKRFNNTLLEYDKITIFLFIAVTLLHMRKYNYHKDVQVINKKINISFKELTFMFGSYLMVYVLMYVVSFVYLMMRGVSVCNANQLFIIASTDNNILHSLPFYMSDLIRMILISLTLSFTIAFYYGKEEREDRITLILVIGFMLFGLRYLLRNNISYFVYNRTMIIVLLIVCVILIFFTRKSLCKTTFDSRHNKLGILYIVLFFLSSSYFLVVIHSLKFELHDLKGDRSELKGITYDTMISAGRMGYRQPVNNVIDLVVEDGKANYTLRYSKQPVQNKYSEFNLNNNLKEYELMEQYMDMESCVIKDNIEEVNMEYNITSSDIGGIGSLYVNGDEYPFSELKLSLRYDASMDSSLIDSCKNWGKITESTRDGVIRKYSENKYYILPFTTQFLKGTNIVYEAQTANNKETHNEVDNAIFKKLFTLKENRNYKEMQVLKNNILIISDDKEYTYLEIYNRDGEILHSNKQKGVQDVNDSYINDDYILLFNKQDMKIMVFNSNLEKVDEQIIPDSNQDRYFMVDDAYYKNNKFYISYVKNDRNYINSRYIMVIEKNNILYHGEQELQNGVPFGVVRFDKIRFHRS